MSRLIKNILLFVLICCLQIYSGADFFVKPAFDFLLIFLIFSFFDFPAPYFLFLLAMRGFVFDSLSGFGWGVNLLSLIFAFGIGFLLIRFLERDNFVSRIVIGESIISVYFGSLWLVSAAMFHLNIGIIIAIDLLINALLYLGLMFLKQYVHQKVFYQKR